MLCILLSHPLNLFIGIHASIHVYVFHANYDIALISIHAAADFTLLDESTQIVFQSGFTGVTQCVDITIVNDTIRESSEFFNTILSSSDPDIIIENEMASVVIIDDDGMLILVA